MPVQDCATVSVFSLATRSVALQDATELIQGMEKDARFSPFYVQRISNLMSAMFQVNAILFRYEYQQSNFTNDIGKTIFKIQNHRFVLSSKVVLSSKTYF